MPVPFASHRDWYLITREFQDDFMFAALNNHLPRFLKEHEEVLEKIAKKLKKVEIRANLPRSRYICKNFLKLLHELHDPNLKEPVDPGEVPIWRELRNIKERIHWQRFMFWFEIDMDQIIKQAFLQRILGIMIEGDYNFRYFFLSDVRRDYHRIDHSYKHKKLVKLTSNLRETIEQERIDAETKYRQVIEERRRQGEEEKERNIKVVDSFGREFIETQEATGEEGKAERKIKIQKIMENHRVVLFSSEKLNDRESVRMQIGLRALKTEFLLVNVDEDLDVRVGIQEYTDHHNFPILMTGVECKEEKEKSRKPRAASF